VSKGVRLHVLFSRQPGFAVWTNNKYCSYLDVHESVLRDTTMKITNKIDYID
jgi:hypothetical protein